MISVNFVHIYKEMYVFRRSSSVLYKVYFPTVMIDRIALNTSSSSSNHIPFKSHSNELSPPHYSNCNPIYQH